MEKAKRYLIFLIGLFVNSLGIALITRANLGTSPISSIPYVLSLLYPPTLGVFTIWMSVVLILLQLLLLRRNFKLEHALQLPFLFLFGYFIDLNMMLLNAVNPQFYPIQIMSLLAGCVVLGFGVYLEVLADVAMLPGESFVRAVSATFKKDFGATKVTFDVSVTAIAVVLSLVLAHRLVGVREGTVIAALLVGFLARLFGRLLAPVKEKLFGASAPAAETAVPEHVQVITIARQYGSGGHDIGEHLAQKLGYAFYDKEMIEATAGCTGYTPEFVRQQEESMTNSLLFDLLNHVYAYSSDNEAPKDAIFEAQANLIREYAAKGNCVIVGRCADYVLKDHPNCLRVFLHAPLPFRIRRIMRTEHLSEQEARAKIEQTDRRRSVNYRYYTRQIWGQVDNYQISVDTSMGETYVENLIVDALREEEKNKLLTSA